MSDFARQIEALRPQLMRFARLQLRNDAWAEDAVSEALLAALERPQAYSGHSQLKTWLVGILKHKVVDQLRRNMREVTSSPDDGEDPDDTVFASDGHFRELPEDWGDPAAACRERQFFEVLEACVEQLPPKLGRAFLMREWLELETDEICKELQITATNMWVMLHRARMRLRECLQVKWFAVPRA